MSPMGNDVACAVKLSIELLSVEDAERVARALEPDNEGFVRTRLDGRMLLAEAEARSIPALLHTLDDYLACLGVAEVVRAPDGRG